MAIRRNRFGKDHDEYNLQTERIKISFVKGFRSCRMSLWSAPQYLTIQVHKCPSHWERDKCEFFMTFPVSRDFCIPLRGYNPLWSPIVDSFRPPIRCPIKQDIQSQKGGKLHLPFSVVSCVLFFWNMASKRRNMFQKNKTQETTENEKLLSEHILPRDERVFRYVEPKYSPNQAAAALTGGSVDQSESVVRLGASPLAITADPIGSLALSQDQSSSIVRATVNTPLRDASRTRSLHGDWETLPSVIDGMMEIFGRPPRMDRSDGDAPPCFKADLMGTYLMENVTYDPRAFDGLISEIDHNYWIITARLSQSSLRTDILCTVIGAQIAVVKTKNV
ncbi:hypothetical protein AAG570_002224 [Ranatra chinensis]|uniref:Uncharacterized protein n=1 Tax=Ranatra chinensis TaxID=642074 RepID=A0ABD0Y6V9_9HEMI